jgi:hypothetical protein
MKAAQKFILEITAAMFLLPISRQVTFNQK